jgi:aspartate racemase
MVNLSVQKLLADGARPRRIGMLASPALRLVGLYDKVMERTGLSLIYPNRQHESELLAVIKAVKAGQLNDGHRRDYARIAGAIGQDGVDAFLIACTELSVIGPPDRIGKPVFDTLDVLVEETIASARA